MISECVHDFSLPFNFSSLIFVQQSRPDQDEEDHFKTTRKRIVEMIDLDTGAFLLLSSRCVRIF